MDFTADQIQSLRYWIQGYQNFYEPIVEECFRLDGYRVLRHPALVRRADIQYIVDTLFDGHKRLGPELDTKAVIQHLKGRTRLQPDFLLQRGDQRFLAELKSWGGMGSGQFDLVSARQWFLKNTPNSAFLLVDWLEGKPIAGKLLVMSSRSPQHDSVLSLLRSQYQTQVELLYLDDIYRTPQLAGTIERQLRYLDAAVAELRQALGSP